MVQKSKMTFFFSGGELLPREDTWQEGKHLNEITGRNAILKFPH